MTAVRYSNGKHYEHVSKWLEARGISAPNRELMPSFGLVVDDVAVGFLAVQNSRLAMIDQVATDPAADPVARQLALTSLFEELEKVARSYGVLVVSAMTNAPTLQEKFVARDYKSAGKFELYYKRLDGGPY